MSLLVFALGAVARRRTRALALGGGLAFAVALLGAVIFLTESLRAEAERARAAYPDVVVQKLIGGRPTVVTSSDAELVATIPSVRRAKPRVWGYVFVPDLQSNVTIVGALRAAPALSIANGTLAEGRDLEPGEHQMIAGAELAKFLGLHLGDELALPSAYPGAPTLRLAGTFRSALDLWTSDVVICDEDDARALLGVPPGTSTDLALELVNPLEARVVGREVLARLAGARVIERDLLTRVYFLAYGRRAGLLLGAAWPALLALFVLAWDRASGVGPGERREIAVLKAVGWSTRDVLGAKLLESMLVGCVATALGLLLAYAWVFWLGAWGLRAALVGWSVLYPRAPLTPAVDAAQLLGIALAVMGPFALISIVPAWRAAMSDPLESMRR